jgi:7-cyano-7-deazaguanine reductase
MAKRKSPIPEFVRIPNPGARRDYVLRIDIPEFTCLCPITGQPDFARFQFEIVPDRSIIELKSLKLYMGAWRNEGAFHEAVTNRILDDVVAAISPRFARLTAWWNVRGGITTTVIAEHRKRGWKAAPRVDLPTGPA